MEYLNIVIFILIFIILLVAFYLIISNFGIVSSNSNRNQDIEKKVNVLKYELSNIQNALGIVQNKNNIIPFSEKSNVQNKNDIHEIIIDSTIPVVNLNNSDITDQNMNLPNQNMNLPNQNNIYTKSPPIIYDPIANYDIAKLTDPLVDPRGRTSADQIPTPQVVAQFNFPTQGVLDRYHRVGLLIAIGSNVNMDERKINKFGIPYTESDSSFDFESESDSINGNNKKIQKNKKSKKYRYNKHHQIDNTTSKSYKGVEIKENFDSDSDADTDYDTDSMEYFGNTDNNVTNIYNVYSNQNDNNILELIGKKITDNWYKYFTSITMGNKIIKVVVKNRNRKELYSGDIVFIPEIRKTYRVKIDPMDMIEYNPYMF